MKGWIIERLDRYYDGREVWTPVGDIVHPTYESARFSLKVLRSLGDRKFRTVDAFRPDKPEGV